MVSTNPVDAAVDAITPRANSPDIESADVLRSGFYALSCGLTLTTNLRSCGPYARYDTLTVDVCYKYCVSHADLGCLHTSYKSCRVVFFFKLTSN